MALAIKTAAVPVIHLIKRKTYYLYTVFVTLGVIGVVGVLVADAPNFEGAKGAKFRRKPSFVSEQSWMSTLSVQKV